jgi:hypothetical protein
MYSTTVWGERRAFYGQIFGRTNAGGKWGSEVSETNRGSFLGMFLNRKKHFTTSLFYIKSTF